MPGCLYLKPGVKVLTGDFPTVGGHLNSQGSLNNARQQPAPPRSGYLGYLGAISPASRQLADCSVPSPGCRHLYLSLY